MIKFYLDRSHGEVLQATSLVVRGVELAQGRGVVEQMRKSTHMSKTKWGRSEEMFQNLYTHYWKVNDIANYYKIDRRQHQRHECYYPQLPHTDTQHRLNTLTGTY